MIESKLKTKNCNRGQLAGSRQLGVALKNRATSKMASHADAPRLGLVTRSSQGTREEY